MDKKWVGLAFFADACSWTVAWVHDGFVRELQKLASQRIEDYFHRAAPKVGASDASCEQRVAGVKLRRCRGGNFAGFLGDVERNATGAVAGRVHYLCSVRSPLQYVAVG